jgi:hypothetical protein
MLKCIDKDGAEDVEIRVPFPAEVQFSLSGSALGPHTLLFHGNWGSWA